MPKSCGRTRARVARTVITALLVGGLLAACTTEGSVGESTPTEIATLPTKSNAGSASGQAPTTSGSAAMTPTKPTFSPSVSVAPSKAPTSVIPVTSTASVEELIKVTIPASIKGKDREDAEKAAKVYREMWAFNQDSGARPGEDWTQEGAEVMADSLLSEDRDTLEELVLNNATLLGQVSATMDVVEVKPQMVVIRGCVDTSQWDLHRDGKSTKAPNRKGSYWRFVQTATIYEYKSIKRWLVSEIDSNFDQTC